MILHGLLETHECVGHYLSVADTMYINLRVNEDVIDVEFHVADLLSGVDDRSGGENRSQGYVLLDVLYLGSDLSTFVGTISRVLELSGKLEEQVTRGNEQ